MLLSLQCVCVCVCAQKPIVIEKHIFKKKKFFFFYKL